MVSPILQPSGTSAMLSRFVARLIGEFVVFDGMQAYPEMLITYTIPHPSPKLKYSFFPGREKNLKNLDFIFF